MLMVEGSDNLYVVEKLHNGNYNIKAYMQDENENGTDSKLVWVTERKPSGGPVQKRNPMESIEIYNELIELAKKVILKFEE